MAAAAVVPGAIVHEVLNQHNYEQWSAQVKTYLMAKDVWEVVEATTEPPKAEDGEAEFKVWKKKNAKALHAIQISCGTQMFSFITTSSTANIAWDTLKKKFMRTVLLPGNTGYDQNDVDSDLERYEPFFDHLEDGDWEAAKEFLTRHPNALRVRRPPSYARETALHLAVRKEHIDIVKEWVGLMTEEDLEIKNAYGDTAFTYAILTGITQMVQCMVEKNKKLLGFRIPNGPNSIIPVLMAYSSGHREMFRYLFSVTPIEYLNGTDGAELITRCVFNEDFDEAWEIIQHFPNLTFTANYDGEFPFYVLAGMRSAFLSGSRLTSCQQWIYNFICIQPTRSINGEKESTPSINDSSINVPELVRDQDDNQRDLNCSVPCSWPQRKKICDAVRSLFRGLVKNLLQLLGINRIYEMKSTHVRILELIHLMCKVTNFRDVRLQNNIRTSIFRAVKAGHVEFITHLCKTAPALGYIRDTKGRSIFQCAIEYRQEKIYSLIYGLGDKEKNDLVSSLDQLNNTLLHTAANVSPAIAVQGAALQMQRELQWFKEVEGIVPARAHERKNLIDGMTARELFTKNHKELLKEGEKSMKETATSCTVVGALIVTIMFAAAFTVPGGNNQDTGVPIFLYQKVFMVFIVSDALSLFSSTTSVMIFLGILTSRYAEGDFFKSLPTKMILGLFTLFFSIATMMIAFSSALVIMLHEKTWIVIPFILLASVPVTSFIWLQFPFLVDIFISTYGSGIFDKKVKPW